MKIQVDGRMFSSCFTLMKIICIYLLLVQFDTARASSKRCPFDYLYHFGDGVTDIGNSLHVLPPFWPRWLPFQPWWLPSTLTNPAGRLPYGITFPGYPTGRWSDGRVDFDYTSEDFGLPNIVPYLGMNKSMAGSYDGVIFSVARRPVLDSTFFKQRNITIPYYADVPLSQQMLWFKDFLNSVCSTESECAKRLGNSLLLLGDIEGNDIGYALTQGKPITEVETYVPIIVKALIDAAREVIQLGATRVIIPGNGPVGCYPYILTELQTSDPSAYDELGCLKSVNELIIRKNDRLQHAMDDLRSEFPDTLILFGPMYDGIRSLIANATLEANLGKHALECCCGIGGKYNYDSERFCGDEGVPVCSNPNDYIYWDGLHFTQQTHSDYEDMLVRPALQNLGCEPLPPAFLRLNRAKISMMDLLSTY